MKDNIFWGIIIGVSVGLFVVGFYKMIYLGTKSDHYEEICIQGHTYYRANFMGKMGIAIKLDENGKPVRCENVE